MHILYLTLQKKMWWHLDAQTNDSIIGEKNACL